MTPEKLETELNKVHTLKQVQQIISDLRNANWAIEIDTMNTVEREYHKGKEEAFYTCLKLLQTIKEGK